jgi:hypothetical protein
MANLLVNALNFPEPGSVAKCACSDGAAVFEIDGREFIGQFDGSISVRVGRHRADPRGALVMPLTIVGYSTTSNIPGLGRTTLDFDFSRPIMPSQLSAASPQELFPAAQTMRLNILMTTDGLPGVTMASNNVGVLVNKNVDSFPPSPGSTYTLRKPVELSDVNKANRVQARLVSVNTSITQTYVAPDELIVGNGIKLYPQQDNFSNVLAAFDPETPIEFSMERKGLVGVNIINSRGEVVLKALDEEKAAGRHTVLVDGSRLRGKEYYYQIQVEGQNRTAKMLLVRQ